MAAGIKSCFAMSVLNEMTDSVDRTYSVTVTFYHVHIYLYALTGVSLVTHKHALLSKKIRLSVLYEPANCIQQCVTAQHLDASFQLTSCLNFSLRVFRCFSASWKSFFVSPMLKVMHFHS